MQAWQLNQDGWSQAEIADTLDVSEGCVSRWMARGHRDGPIPLLAHPVPGRPPKLEPEQTRLIPDFLAHGAEAYGFVGEVWTCARVGQVIEEEFGIAYHKSQVARLLKKLHWTPQMPIARAIQRDEEEIGSLSRRGRSVAHSIRRSGRRRPREGRTTKWQTTQGP
jgi:transposase